MRKILLVIDMQNDFIDGALGTLEAEAIIDKVVQVIYKYPLEDIIATRDTHGKDYLETQEGRKLPVPHCIKGTLGYNLHPRITAALNGATIMGKSSFASKKLAEKVAALAKTDELEVTIVGLCTDICVVSNAAKPPLQTSLSAGSVPCSQGLRNTECRPAFTGYLAEFRGGRKILRSAQNDK